jgi:hypothetical protein
VLIVSCAEFSFKDKPSICLFKLSRASELADSLFSNVSLSFSAMKKREQKIKSTNYKGKIEEETNGVTERLNLRTILN